MSVDANKALVRRYFEEVWNKGRRDAIDEFCAADGVIHGLDGKATSGLEALKAFQAKFLAAFPDHRVHVDALIAEGDLVVAHWSRTATHTGHGLPFAPTNKAIAFSGISIFRVANGKLAEGWNAYDRLDMLHQLGQLPATRAL